MKYLKNFNENSNFNELINNLLIDMIDRDCRIRIKDVNYCDLFNPKFIESDINTLRSDDNAYTYLLDMALKDKDTHFDGIEVVIHNMKGDEFDVNCIKFANEYLLGKGYEFKHIAYQVDGVYYYSNDIQYDKNLIELNKFKSITEASKYTGVPISGISACCVGKIKKSGGFIWEYETI